jgi:hypothetical protein
MGEQGKPPDAKQRVFQGTFRGWYLRRATLFEGENRPGAGGEGGVQNQGEGEEGGEGGVQSRGEEGGAEAEAEAEDQGCRWEVRGRKAGQRQG